MATPIQRARAALRVVNRLETIRRENEQTRAAAAAATAANGGDGPFPADVQVQIDDQTPDSPAGVVGESSVHSTRPERAGSAGLHSRKSSRDTSRKPSLEPPQSTGTSRKASLEPTSGAEGLNGSDAVLAMAHQQRQASKEALGRLGLHKQPNKPLPLDRFRQAVGDVQNAQNLLRRDSGSQGPPKTAEQIFQALGQVATGYMATPGSALRTTASHDAKQKAPGMVNWAGDAKVAAGLIKSSWINVLLICIPLGWLSHFLHWGNGTTFILNIVSLIPLALVLGEITEDLALRFGDTIGGLLNATFGNVVELILSIAALAKGLYVVVAASLIGSILSNLLLVLGTCFFLGGCKYKTQNFNPTINKAACSLLFLAAIAITIPSASNVLYSNDVITNSALTKISHGTAILLALIYLAYLFFQLYTHREIFAGEESDEQPVLSLTGAILLLTAITVTVAISSEFLTSAIEGVSKSTGLSEAFLGLIILPIAGNACEHITAVFVAMKNKMDLAIGVALGSSIQIAIFVLPVLVLVGWAINKPFTLDLDPFLILMLTLSVIHASFVSSDGQSNWLMGVQLIGTYILIALLFAFLSQLAGQNSSSLMG